MSGVPNKRRRRDRRPRQPDHPEPPRATVKKADQRKKTEFEARMARIARTRTLVGLVGFVPLTMSLACATIDLGPVCGVPREIYLGLWAAIFGTFLGLTIRMWRERRAFERNAGAT
jgi:hypothetical protein